MGAFAVPGQDQIQRHHDRDDEHAHQERARRLAQDRRVGVGLKTRGRRDGRTEQGRNLGHRHVGRGGQERFDLLPKRSLAARRRLGDGGAGPAATAHHRHRTTENRYKRIHASLQAIYFRVYLIFYIDFIIIECYLMILTS